MLGRHVCRTKLPPENIHIDTKKGLKNTKKDLKNDPKKAKIVLVPLRSLKKISPALSKKFSPHKTGATIFFLFTATFYSQRRRNDDENAFWEVESNRESAGGSKRGSTGNPPWNFIVGLKHRKNSILESRISIVVAFPRRYSDNNFGQLPPPPWGDRIRGRTNPRIIVGENSCHFGASYAGVATLRRWGKTTPKLGGRCGPF